MKWEAWILAVSYLVSIIFTPLTVGKPRKALTPELACGTVIGGLLGLWLVLRLAGVA